MITETGRTEARHDAAPTSEERGAITAPPAAERPSPDGGAPSASAGKRRRLHARTRRRLLWGAAAVVLALLLVYAFRPTPLEIESAHVVSGPLETTVNAEGMTRVHERYLVAAPVSGRVERIALREGDAVEAGTVVARINPLPLDPQATAQARAQLAGAQALQQEANARVAQTREGFEQAQRDVARARELAGAGALSPQAREEAELQLATAQREYQAVLSRSRAASAEVGNARAALLSVAPDGSGAVVNLRSPAGGQVLRVPEESERVVSAGTPLIEIGDPRGLEVVVDVLSTDAVRIRPGAPMRLVEWGGEGALEGRVRRIEPSGFTKVSALGVEEQRVNVIGELQDPPAALGDGYRVEAQIITWQADRVLKVPVSALFRRGEEWAVFVVEAERARVRPVRLGHRGAAEAEVLAGLEAGEEIVVYPSDRIADGARVRAR